MLEVDVERDVVGVVGVVLADEVRDEREVRRGNDVQLRLR